MTDLRRATAADVAAIEEVAALAYTPYLSRMDDQRPGPLDADYAADVAAAEGWVALEDDTVVGFVLLVPEGDTLLLDNVAVRPSHHGRGLGRTLLALAEERAVAHGCSRIRLYTHVTMVENQRLYERLGYVETRRATDQGLTRVFYEKAL